MFLRASTRKKDGKTHRYYSVVENKRVSDGRVVQRHVLYLGEINASQEQEWARAIEVFNEGTQRTESLSLFPAQVSAKFADRSVQLKLNELSLRNPRQYGACWLALHLWRTLQLDVFWSQRLSPTRKGTHWDQVLTVLVIYRLLSPGSEWRLHRSWFLHTALPDLLGVDFSVADTHALYGCHDHLIEHKRALFTHLTNRWRDLFNARFEVLLYDLTSTYFESNPPFPDDDKRRYGYSRDKRSDCVQVVIALIVTPEGLPIAYEVMPGNTSDKTTLKDFLAKIETQYGKVDRTWVMDRGIPTEAVLSEMRANNVSYLVGTPKGRLNKLQTALLAKPWCQARESVKVKLLPQDGEMYIYAQSQARIGKERSMRKRQLKWLWARLKALADMKSLTRDELMIKLGGAKDRSPSAWRLVTIDVHASEARFSYALNKPKLKAVRSREGRYLLRTNLTETDPAKLWEHYLQLTQVEEAFKNLKGDLSLRPIYHQREDRIEAHIFISFLAYCLHVTLKQQLKALAPGLTPRSALEQFATVQMLDVHIPTTDNRELILTRHTQPSPELNLLLNQLKLAFPAQPPPKITAHSTTQNDL
jgi:transposase